jgi:hypothetical protein
MKSDNLILLFDVYSSAYVKRGSSIYLTVEPGKCEWCLLVFFWTSSQFFSIFQ